MTNEIIPNYIIDLKKDLINHIDSSINDLAVIIHNTVALKSDIEDMVRKDDIKNMVVKNDIKDMATKQDLEDIRREMATKEDIRDMVTKEEMKPILGLIGSYAVRAKNIEDILLEDHKPRIIDLEKEVYSRV